MPRHGLHNCPPGIVHHQLPTILVENTTTLQTVRATLGSKRLCVVCPRWPHYPQKSKQALTTAASQPAVSPW